MRVCRHSCKTTGECGHNCTPWVVHSFPSPTYPCPPSRHMARMGQTKSSSKAAWLLRKSAYDPCTCILGKSSASLEDILKMSSLHKHQRIAAGTHPPFIYIPDNLSNARKRPAASACINPLTCAKGPALEACTPPALSLESIPSSAAPSPCLGSRPPMHRCAGAKHGGDGSSNDTEAEEGLLAGAVVGSTLLSRSLLSNGMSGMTEGWSRTCMRAA